MLKLRCCVICVIVGMSKSGLLMGICIDLCSVVLGLLLNMLYMLMMFVRKILLNLLCFSVFVRLV